MSQHSSGIEAQVIADSISPDGKRLTTLQICAPKFVDAEQNTHRLLSQNSGSDRAKPMSKTLDEVKYDPFLPPELYYNEKGMQGSELLSHVDKEEVLADIESLSFDAVHVLNSWNGVVHKQHLNRYLLPFAWQYKVVTATEWDNFFALRMSEEAQPEFRILAECMYEAMENSKPSHLTPGDWHLPYVDWEELETNGLEKAKKASVARCARVSYKPYDQVQSSVEKDLGLYEMLYENKHLSPMEHPATPMVEHSMGEEFNGGNYWEQGVTHMDREGRLWSGNFVGWIQHRHML